MVTPRRSGSTVPSGSAALNETPITVGIMNATASNSLLHICFISRLFS